MNTSDCIFCKIAAGNIPCVRVFENEDVLAFLDIAPVSDGHTLLIPKTHIERLDSCSQQLLARTTAVLPRLAQAVASSMNAPAYNILSNNGAAAGQIVNHLHFHIIPRKPGDGVFDRWPAYKYQAGRAELIAEKIRQKL
jgi:histidine triad (HIT) family protein